MRTSRRPTLTGSALLRSPVRSISSRSGGWTRRQGSRASQWRFPRFAASFPTWTRNSTRFAHGWTSRMRSRTQTPLSRIWDWSFPGVLFWWRLPVNTDSSATGRICTLISTTRIFPARMWTASWWEEVLVNASTRSHASSIPSSLLSAGTDTGGATSVICTDKTGILTKNQMQVYETAFAGLSDQALLEENTSSLIKECIAVNTTANLDFADPSKIKAIGNPTEGALLLWLHKAGVN